MDVQDFRLEKLKKSNTDTLHFYTGPPGKFIWTQGRHDRKKESDATGQTRRVIIKSCSSITALAETSEPKIPSVRV